MDASPAALVKALAPKVPLLLSAAAGHTFGMTENSAKWDLRQELTVKLIRSFIGGPKPSPISKQQHLSLKDPGIKGKLWICKVTAPKPEENDVQKAVVDAVDALKMGEEKYTVPDVVPVEAEWTGYRAGVSKDRPRPDLTEEQHYQKLMAEVTSSATVLYIHGGAHYLMDPSSHRPVCSKLAKETGGRCLSVRYRLSPQSAFPAALMDCLVAYLYLLSPPEGSYHTPVEATHIVFSGDSAGGNLALALLQLILQFHRASPGKVPTISMHGKEVEVPLPAGLALNSPWVDITRCMPSITENLRYDYLPAPPSGEDIARFPKCDIWPTNPPRGDIYCEVSMLCHPLVSPLAAADWVGSPPMWMVYGQECLTDEGKALATKVVAQGVKVRWIEFEAMPHCFAMVFPGTKVTKKAFKEWSQFITEAVDGKPIETVGTYVVAKTLKQRVIDVARLSAFSDDQVRQMMKEAQVKRDVGLEGEAKVMPRL